MADLPVKAEGIAEAADSPAVALRDWEHLGASGRNGSGEEGVGIGDGENEAK